MGLDWRWERLNVVQPPSPTGVVHVHRRRQRSAGHAEHRHAAGELPARAGAAVLDRSAAVADSGAGACPGVLHPGRLEGLGPADAESRPALHAELSRRPRSTARRRSSTCRRSSSSIRATNPVRPLEEEQLRTAPGRRLPRHRTRRSSAPATVWSGSRWPASPRRSRRRRFRSCRPFRSARWTRSTRRSCCRTDRRSRRSGRRQRRPGAGRVRGRRHARLRLRAAVERLGPA